MKNSWQILTLLMAVALVVMAINVTRAKSNNKRVAASEVKSDGDIVYDAIMTRSSVRSYTQQPIEPEVVEKLLRAGLAAPTAGNRQPWELIVVSNKETLTRFGEIIPGAHMAPKAPLAIVVLGTPAKALMPEYWVQDCSAVTENILLAAHGMGLGAVWCGAYPNNSANRVGAISELLELPEGTMALSIVVVGHPDSEPHVKDKWDSSKIHYEKY